MCGQGVAQIRAGLEARDRANTQAELLTFQHKDAKDRGRSAANLVRERAGEVQGAQRASYAGQGVDVESGSALATQTDTARLSEMEALEIRNNAAREAWGYRMQRKFVKHQGDVAVRTGYAQGYQTIMSQVAKAITGGMGG